MTTSNEFNHKTFLYISILNTFMCLVLFVVSWGVLVANVMQGANAGGVLLVYASLIYPAIPVISIVLFWIAFRRKSKKLSIIFHLIPWAYTLFLGLLLFLSFN